MAVRSVEYPEEIPRPVATAKRTSQAMTVSPDAHGTSSLISFLTPLPERLLAFDQPGFSRTSPDSSLDIVLSLILSSSAFVASPTGPTRAQYSSTHLATPTLKYGRHGQPAAFHTALRTSATSDPYVFPRPLRSRYSTLPFSNLMTYLRDSPVVLHTSSMNLVFRCGNSPS